MLNVIISLQSEDPKVCELGIIIIYASSEYPCFFHQFSFWIPKNRIIHSLCAYKDTWELFRNCDLSFVLAEHKSCWGSGQQEQAPWQYKFMSAQHFADNSSSVTLPIHPLGSTHPFLPGAKHNWCCSPASGK